MIDDKVAKMAANTIKMYCQQFDNCGTCAMQENCCISLEARCDRLPISMIRCFPRMNLYMDVGSFINSDISKTPKFDVAQKDSGYFKEYINKIIVEEEKKYEIPVKWGISTEWTADGRFKIAWYDNDGQLKCVGTAKCHPADAFNPEIGIKLAVERAAQAMHAPFVPEDGEAYYYVDDENLIYSTINHNSNKDALNIAVGNCFRKYKEAEANAAVIMKRIKKAAELLKKLRDEYRGEGMM